MGPEWVPWSPYWSGFGSNTKLCKSVMAKQALQGVNLFESYICIASLPAALMQVPYVTPQKHLCIRRSWPQKTAPLHWKEMHFLPTALNSSKRGKVSRRKLVALVPSSSGALWTARPYLFLRESRCIINYRVSREIEANFAQVYVNSRHSSFACLLTADILS